VSLTAAVLTVLVPATFAVLGMLRWRPGTARADLSAEWAVTAAVGTVLAALTELFTGTSGSSGSSAGSTVPQRVVLGEVSLGDRSPVLQLATDSLSATVAVAVAVVALCVQVYSIAYLRERYRPYAATVSLFTAAMMLLVHAGDLITMLIGWEVMGLCSYLLVGHHSERQAARAAAMKAFLVTRTGDLGVLLAVVILLVATGTTSIPAINTAAAGLPAAVVVPAALLLLAGVAGKSAQFPLHTWLPDAMEGPTPVSALIHAATMVAAGAFLMARLLPLFQAAPPVLVTAAVLACITMLGAALAALAQDDLKRLLAWSTISQMAYLVAGLAVAAQAGPAIGHLLSHAAFKALLFLIAGAVITLTGTQLLAGISAAGGLWPSRRGLAVLTGLGLGALAGLPPLSGFWSKEAVLTAAEQTARAGAEGTQGLAVAGWLVAGVGLITALVTGLYAGRVFVLVVIGENRPAPETAEPAPLPRMMTWPLWLLAVPTVALGLAVPLGLDALTGSHLDPVTAVTGALVSLTGVAWALSAPRLGGPDVAVMLPGRLRAFLREGYRLDAVQDAAVVRPYRRLAGWVHAADLDVVDIYPRGAAAGTWTAAGLLRRVSTGSATSYLAWTVLGALALGLAGVILS